MDAIQWFLTFGQSAVMLIVAILVMRKMKKYEPEEYLKNLRSNGIIFGALFAVFAVINLLFLWF